MIGPHHYLIQQRSLDRASRDDIYTTLERAMAKSECELCESARHTDSEYGMDVCQSCQRELLPT